MRTTLITEISNWDHENANDLATWLNELEAQLNDPADLSELLDLTDLPSEELHPQLSGGTYCGDAFYACDRHRRYVLGGMKWRVMSEDELLDELIGQYR